MNQFALRSPGIVIRYYTKKIAYNHKDVKSDWKQIMATFDYNYKIRNCHTTRTCILLYKRQYSQYEYWPLCPSRLSSSVVLRAPSLCVVATTSCEIRIRRLLLIGIRTYVDKLVGARSSHGLLSQASLNLYDLMHIFFFVLCLFKRSNYLFI